MADSDNRNLDNNEEFQRYRQQMHKSDYEDNEQRPKPSLMRTIFGIFMVLIYLLVGILLLTNWFNYPDTAGWNIARWVVGIVLIIYGIWRGYRQYAGIDSRF